MKEIGRRLKEVRELLGLTQKEVAEKLGISQAYIALIEKGEREISLSMLFKLAEIYHRPVDYFIKSKKMPFIKFRTKTLAKKEKTEIIEFENWCRNYAELEEIIGEKIEYPAFEISDNLKIRAIKKEKEAIKTIARIIREQLGVGNMLCKNLKDILDNSGFKVFNLPIKTLKISGAFLYSEELGPCILINANHSEGRQNFTLAHELTHYAFDKTEEPLIDHIEDLIPGKGKGKEYVINEIAGELLMPEDLILKGIKYIGGIKKINKDIINILKEVFRVTYSALLYRLYKLGLITKNEYLSLRLPSKEFAIKEIKFDPEKHLPHRYLKLALRAYLEEKISIGELCEYLGKDINWVKKWVKERIEQGEYD